MKASSVILFLLFLVIIPSLKFKDIYPPVKRNDVSRCTYFYLCDVIKLLDTNRDRGFYVRDDVFMDISNDKFFPVTIDAQGGYIILSFNLGGTIDEYYLVRSF